MGVTPTPLFEKYFTQPKLTLDFARNPPKIQIFTIFPNFIIPMSHPLAPSLSYPQ